jgi:hypothetical protein
MKTLLLLGLVALAPALNGAETLTTTITESTKMEVTRGKGTIMLKAGTVVNVIGREGDQLDVVYRNVTGLVSVAKTDFKGEAPKSVAKPAQSAASKANPDASKPAPVEKPAPAKPAEEKASAPNRDDPASTYGKMVKKARDNEAKHKDNMVDPTDSATGSK